jgi:hypothetical protein
MLFKNHLLLFTGDDQLPMLSRSLRIDERITGFLLGTDIIDQKLRKFSYIIEPGTSFDDMIIEQDKKQMLWELTGLLSSMKKPVMFFFQGPYGTGKKTTARAMCRKSTIPLLVVDSNGLKGNESFEMLNLILREALLLGSSLYFEGFDALFEKESGVSATDLIRHMDSFSNPIFVSGGKITASSGSISLFRHLHLEKSSGSHS